MKRRTQSPSNGISKSRSHPAGRAGVPRQHRQQARGGAELLMRPESGRIWREPGGNGQNHHARRKHEKSDDPCPESVLHRNVDDHRTERMRGDAPDTRINRVRRVACRCRWMDCRRQRLHDGRIGRAPRTVKPNTTQRDRGIAASVRMCLFKVAWELRCGPPSL